GAARHSGAGGARSRGGSGPVGRGVRGRGVAAAAERGRTAGETLHGVTRSGGVLAAPSAALRECVPPTGCAPCRSQIGRLSAVHPSRESAQVPRGGPKDPGRAYLSRRRKGVSASRTAGSSIVDGTVTSSWPSAI